MTRKVIIEMDTDHDDTLDAVRSVIANLSRAGYVVVEQMVLTTDEKPEQHYAFVTGHAELHVAEIDLYMEETRRANEDKD